MSDRQIHLHAPVISDEDRKAVDSVLSNVLNGQKTLQELEEKLCEFTGYSNAVLVNSATTGIQLCVEVMHKQGPICVPALTFAATWSAAKRGTWNIKSNFRFQDISIGHWTWREQVNVLEEDLEVQSTKITAIPVELNGVPCGLFNECNTIVDSAGALRKDMRREHVGVAAAVVSFNTNKIITGLGGGVVLTDDGELAATIRSLADQGKKDGDATEPGLVGTNGRISYMSAALVSSQLDRWGQIRDHKKLLHNRYVTQLDGCLGLQDGSTNHWMTCGTLKSRTEVAEVLEALEKENIHARRMYQPPQLLKDPRWKSTYMITKQVARRGIQLPSGLDLTIEDVDRVCEAVKRAVS